VTRLAIVGLNVFALAALFAGVDARAQGSAQVAEIERIEKEVGIADGEQRRIEDQSREVPDLFTTEDRGERMTWGEIYYLTKEYQRASMLLFGAVEPRESDRSPVENRPDYADGLYYLADSLYLLGNVSAAQAYFVKLLKLRGHGHHAVGREQVPAAPADTPPQP